MEITDSINQQDLIQIINRLARKKREEGLTSDEEKQQKAAYAVYLKRIRAQFDGELDGVKIKTPDGRITPFKKFNLK